MIKQKSGEIDILPYKKAASTAFTRNDVVTKDASGYLVLATASTPRSELVGLIDRDVASTDSDYASNTMCNVTLLAGSGKEFECDVDGTLTQAMVGEQFDLNDEDSVDVTSNAIGHVTLVRYISASKGIFKFNLDGKTNFVRKSYSQVVSYSEFTDGGGAAGTLDLGISIPAGAVFEQTLISALTGFTGDTSAALTVGDGTDVDRYNTGTPSVFTTAAAGIDAGVPSGTRFHSAAKTPKLTVTSNADFTSVTAGAMKVTLVWLEAA